MNIVSIDFVACEHHDKWLALLNGHFGDAMDLGDMISISAVGATRAESIQGIRSLAARMGEIGQQAVAHMEVFLAKEQGALS